MADRDVELWLRSPLDVDAARLAAARRRLGEAPGARVAELVKADRALDAERFVLALGHSQAVDHPDSPRAVLTERSLSSAAWRALPRKRGAYLRIVMAAARCHRTLRRLAGGSPEMCEVRAQVWKAGFGDSLWHALELESVVRDHDVLIQGETGTGKEIVARALLEARPGAADGTAAPRAALNAAAVPETLIGSELFGHVKGAFTGANVERRGRIRSAHGGCFFLDEVGDLPKTTQVKLLRVIETNQVNPLGSDKDEPVDVRYIAATHKSLVEMVERGAFRRDLYQRLADCVIHLPPLRARPQDIEEIGLAFVDGYLEGRDGLGELRARVERFLRSRAARGQRWEGNVRQLQNHLRGALLGHVPQLAPAGRSGQGEAAVPPEIAELRATMDEVEQWYLRRVLEHTDNNYAEAARVLGLDRSTVRRKARG